MKLSDLTLEDIEKLKLVRWDRIIEKHEGPEDWGAVLRYSDPEFIMIEGQAVLLPIDQSHHPNLTILRTIWSENKSSLTLFLKDTTYEDDWSMSGFMSVCDKKISQEFYIAILYHEWFIIEESQRS